MDAASALDRRPSSGGDLGADLEKALSKLRAAEPAAVCSVYVERSMDSDSVEQAIAFRLQGFRTCHIFTSFVVTLHCCMKTVLR